MIRPGCVATCHTYRPIARMLRHPAPISAGAHLQGGTRQRLAFAHGAAVCSGPGRAAPMHMMTITPPPRDAAI
ncbi:MAG: hypothetical protein Q4G25_15980 [Paracoccus sp. (in: a-proteobacteria)]|nr:hypothetical protein [Paracoccus sp. (in: a-proteobacteria)]